MATLTHELYWVAGFLEGEGNFALRGRKRTSPVASACQVGLHPLERLQRIVGGRIAPYNSTTHVWTLNENRTIQLAMTLYPLMSPKRKIQIQKVIEAWKAKEPSPWHKPSNHLYYVETVLFTKPRKVVEVGEVVEIEF